MKKAMLVFIFAFTCFTGYADTKKDIETAGIYVMTIAPIAVYSVASVANDKRADQYAVTAVVIDLIIGFVYTALTNGDAKN